MNINSNELLLLKKVKFGEDTTNKQAELNAVVTEPSTEVSPQEAMKALNFQGLNNVVSNPELASELKIMNEEINPQEAEKSEASNEEYVAPYKSNIAFQGSKAAFLKKPLMSMMVALSMLGGAATLQSCDDKEVVVVPGSSDVSVTVNVDMTAITAIFQQMQMMWQQMLDQQKITNEQMQKNNEFMQKLITLYQQGNASANEFYSKMYDFIMSSTANQEIVISLLEQNGMTLEEAKNTLNQILFSNKTDSEKMDQIIKLLGDIKGLVSQAVNYLEKAEQDRAKLLSTADDIKNATYVGNEQREKLIAQNDSLIASNKLVNENLTAIGIKIDNASLKSDAKFDEVVSTLKMNKNDLIRVMVRLGFTQNQIINMNAAEIKAAIKENTEATKNTNTRLEEINNQLKDNHTDVKEAANEIINLLNQINSNILELTNSFNNFVKGYKEDKNQAMKMLCQIIRNGRVQTSILASIQNTQKNMATDISGIKANTDALLDIAKDDTKYNELMKQLKEIASKGSSNIDYQKFEQMFKLLNMNLTDVIKMSRSELVAAIKDFENTYVKTEQKQTEELQTIQAKIDDLQIFISNNNNKDLLDAINKLNQSVNNGNADVTNELKNIEAQLNKIQATLDSIFKSIGSQASKTDAYFQKWDAKFEAILGSIDDLKSRLNTMIANQKTANVYLNSLDNEVKNLKAEIQKLQNQGGSNIDYDKLDQMWKEHDAANYEKYSKLIKELGIDPTKLKNIEDLLKSIDSKMDYIKENSSILTNILNKLKDFAAAHPDYNGKLDKIIKLLENFKFNCNCGNNNEGIQGKLDDILG